MSKYSISARKMDVIHEPRISGGENEFGVMITIEPPIELAPTAVRNYLMTEMLLDDDKHYTEDGINEIRGVQLLGSTNGATSIYVGAVESDDFGLSAEEIETTLVERTVKLVELLGSTAARSK